MSDCESTIGNIVDVKQNTFWYLACLVCNTKKPSNEKCFKCGGQNFSYRYRVCFDADTSFGAISLTVFGKSLERYFGTTAADFQTQLSSSNVTNDEFKLSVQKYFVGSTLMLDHKLLHVIKKKKKSSSFTSSFCTKELNLVDASSTTLLDSVKQIKEFKEFSFDVSALFRLSTSEETSSTSRLPSYQSHLLEASKHQLDFSNLSTDERKVFLQDTFIKELLRQTSFEMSSRDLVSTSSTNNSSQLNDVSRVNHNQSLSENSKQLIQITKKDSEVMTSQSLKNRLCSESSEFEDFLFFKNQIKVFSTPKVLSERKISLKRKLEEDKDLCDLKSCLSFDLLPVKVGKSDVKDELFKDFSLSEDSVDLFPDNSEDVSCS